MNNARKLSDFYQEKPFQVWSSSTPVKLADIVPTTLTVQAIAKVHFGDSVSYAYLCDDGREVVTSAQKLVEIGDALTSSDIALLSRDQPERVGVVAYDLVEPVSFRIEKVTTAGGRSFYAVSDE